MSIFSFLSASSITNASSGGSILGAVLVIGIFFVSTVLPILDKKIASFIGICSSLLIAGVFIGLLSDLKSPLMNSGLAGSVSFTGIYIIIIIVSLLTAMYNIVSLIDFKTISLNIIKKESKSKECRLRELQSLKEQELISEEEYQKKRTEVINE